jgi:hypothetical protein
VALPLGGRVKMDPWNDEVDMLKSKPVGTVAEQEKMPFEITPFMLYLTRETSGSSSDTPAAASPVPQADATAAPQGHFVLVPAPAAKP